MIPKYNEMYKEINLTSFLRSITKMFAIFLSVY